MKLMTHTQHWKYMASRRLYGRSRLYVWMKTLRLWSLWMWYRNSDETTVVTCWKCDCDFRVSKGSLYYYDNTKCVRCYL